MTAQGAARGLGETSQETLARRAESLAQEPAAEEVSDLLSMLLFRFGEEWYSVDVADVREIFQEYTVTSLPCTPEFILGVTNVRGEILSVTDPAALMSLGRIVGPADAQAPAIVLTNGLVATAIIVDEIGDIIEVRESIMEPPVSIIDRAQAEFVAGSMFVNEMMVGVLSVERVLEPVGTTNHR